MGTTARVVLRLALVAAAACAPRARIVSVPDAAAVGEVRPGVLLHRAWPSTAPALWHVRDRNAALFARDGPEETLAALREAGTDRVILAAHSPGEMLAMETLRQAAIAGHALPDGVIPTSPDLDAAPFRPQAARIGTLPEPFAIFVSGRCRAPPLSARIARAGERLGALRGAGQVADLAVTMLGVTAYDSGGAEHFTAGGFPALVAMPSRMRALAASHDGPEAAPVGLLPGTVLMLQDATRAVLDPPLP